MKSVPFHDVWDPSLKPHRGFLRFNSVTLGRQKDLFRTLLKLSDCYIINECSEGWRGMIVKIFLTRYPNMQLAKFLYKSLRNACLLISSAVALNGESILTVADTYRTGIYDKSASEIVAFDPLSKRVFVSNDNNNTLDVFRLEQNASLSKLFSLSMASHGAGVNAVAIKNGLVAVAVEANPKQNPGKVAIFSSVVEMNGTALTSVQVGALPDHLAFTNDGNTLVVANEG